MAARKRVKKPSTPDVVEGVRMSEFKHEVFESAYATALADYEAQVAAGKKPPVALVKEVDLVDRIKMLVLWYRAVTPNNELGGCSECGGDSDVRLECCPFCGDAELVDDDGNPVEGDGLEVAPEDQAEPEPAVVAPTVEVVDAEGTVVSPAGTTGGTEDEVVLAKFKVSDLDNSVGRCGEYKRDAANSLWRLGREIKTILEENLWMLRVSQSGHRRYRTFKQFVVGELDMSYTHAHRLMQVAEAFNEKEMKQVGVSKCQLLLQVPKDVRDGLLEKAKTEGTTRAQLSEEVQNLTGKERSERPKPPEKTKKKMTVALAEERIELQLYARPKGREGYPSAIEEKDNLRPAKNIGDDPFAIELLPNDVRVSYHLAREKDGSMLLVIERRRATEDEVFGDEESGE